MSAALFFYLLSLVCWLGAIIFFSFFIAPLVFTRLSVADAGNLVAAIFPRYYLLGCVAGVVALLLAIYLTAARGPFLPWGIAVILLAAAAALTFYAAIIVRPRVDSLRHVAEQTSPIPAEKTEFDHLHRLSVVLNGAVLVLDLVALAASAVALAPRV